MTPPVYPETWFRRHTAADSPFHRFLQTLAGNGNVTMWRSSLGGIRDAAKIMARRGVGNSLVKAALLGALGCAGCRFLSGPHFVHWLVRGKGHMPLIDLPGAVMGGIRDVWGILMMAKQVPQDAVSQAVISALACTGFRGGASNEFRRWVRRTLAVDPLEAAEPGLA